MNESFRRLVGVTVSALAVLATQATPAGATTIGGGVVHGSVGLAPGVGPGLGCRAQAFAFTPTQLAGEIVVHNTAKGNPTGDADYTGPITTGYVTGGTAGPQPGGLCPPGTENTVAASGIVNPFGFAGVYGVCAVACQSVNGTASGVYLRLGSVVIVTLTANVCVTDFVLNTPTLSGCWNGATVTVVAQFTPTSGDGITTPITNAAFDGIWALLGV